MWGRERLQLTVNILISMRKIGYIRVSKQDQRPDRQIAGLDAICDELHVETISAVSAARPIFDAILVRLRPGEALVIWELDRAFRDVDDARTVAFDLMSRGVRFQIVDTSMDLSNPDDLLSYTVRAAVAENERLKISKRTREGLAVARANGKRLGRPPKLNEAQIAAARLRLCLKETTITALANEFGVAPWTLTRSLRRQKAAVAGATDFR